NRYMTLIVNTNLFLNYLPSCITTENMSLLASTSLQAFANQEDTSLASSTGDKKKLVRVDPDVERVRRCHQNDLENIIPFIVIGLLYTLTGPDLSTALLHFRVFVGSRLFHTVAYVLPLPQPSRAVAFLIGLVTTSSMAYRVLMTALYL
uniref:Microsomal glutathione S-transferase 1 n=1 Tax=Oncorhynchus tshawytscha TaxID=74940 RepID=A0AAZ3Q182_ONCTS